MRRSPLFIFHRNLGLLILILFSCTSPADPAGFSSEEEFLLEVNKLRTQGCQCGSTYMPPVPPLRWNAQLEEAARKHARDLEQRNKLTHAGRDGSTVGQRVKRTGYEWGAVGENIASGYSSAAEAMEGWRQSVPHCKTMMNPDFSEMGAASSGLFWVQVFGHPW